MSNDIWIDDAGPRLLAALPCEDGAASVAIGDHRATLQRIFYDLYADRFPASFTNMNVATLWMGGEGTYTVGARLSDPDGDVLAEVEMEYQAHPEPATAVLFVHFSSDGALTLVLPRPGRYSVDVLLEGVPISTFPLFVVQHGQTEEGERR
jgi:hypothetical protein